ncbi:unnamed protein product [Protopolystoma xenopodis]|uniref:Uncharacterized protein n=1 Tax=Protopolystoma xenopodis TaxID=117903 RepID=A0A3S5A2B9_9PLAT|nr:unnamed protein product [Protopolystoma xenopodis]
MERLTDDAGETSGNEPRPQSDLGHNHAYNGFWTSAFGILPNRLLSCLGKHSTGPKGLSSGDCLSLTISSDGALLASTCPLGANVCFWSIDHLSELARCLDGLLKLPKRRRLEDFNDVEDTDDSDEDNEGKEDDKIEDAEENFNDLTDGSKEVSSINADDESNSFTDGDSSTNEDSDGSPNSSPYQPPKTSDRANILALLAPSRKAKSQLVPDRQTLRLRSQFMADLINPPESFIPPAFCHNNDYIADMPQSHDNDH